MKAKKFNFDWRSMVLGMALCLALVVFVASMARGAQSDSRSEMLRKQVTMVTLMDKSELIDQRILVLEGKINHLKYLSDDILRNVVQLNQKVK
ncbi:MAG TPA: hypothetical protein VLQ89_09340 [Candidatus Binatia bacterium]|nr:hypothetical protein [Candidatus Binatia bacterium]